MRFRCVYKSDKETFKLVWAKHAWNLVCDLTWPLVSLTPLLWGTYGSGVSWHVFIPLQYTAQCLLAWGCRAPCLLLQCHDSGLSREQERELDWSPLWSLETNSLLWLLSVVGGGGKVGKKPPLWHAPCTSGPPSAPTCYLPVQRS